MAAISALMVNDTVMRREPYDEDRTPTTPRAVARMLSPSRGHQNLANEQANVATTDTSSPSPQHSSPSTQSKSNDLKRGPIDDDDSDAMDVDQNQDDLDGSDNDTEQGESGTSSRKKKGQRFFCTGYPPCNLSFTRSEHLARHIRKHTGERPFQCHCNRRFSRLDNLRQHAQTVHVNEEIPTDSLAATGTRFQRQIRTDRVRPAGRPRSGTMSSTGTHSRGHSRNLSTSSIGSTSSNYSTSTVDPRRRPAPLIMAGDGRPKLGVEPPSTPPPPQFGGYATYSPGDIPTPTSATLSAAPGSPAFGSPVPSGSRIGLYGGTRTPGRRLSVPSAASNLFPSPYPPPFPAYPSQAGINSATASSNNSTITSPTTSTFSLASSSQTSATEDWRRRTWHPSTYSGVNLYGRPATSGLTYSQTPDAPQPAFAQNATAAAGQAPRLPGIESFDHVQQRPSTPPRLQPGGQGMEASRLPTLMPPAEFGPRTHSLGHAHGHGYGPVHGHRRHISADVPRYGRYSGYGDRGPLERSSVSWTHDTTNGLQQAAGRPGDRGSEGVRYSMAPPTTSAGAPPSHTPGHDAQHGRAPGGPGGRPSWNPPPVAIRTSPEDSGSSEGVPTPGTSTTDVNPAIMPASGIFDAHSAALPHEANHNPCFAPPPSLTTIPNGPSTAPHVRESVPRHGHSRSASDMNRLDALAAVATIENNASAPRR